MSTHQKSSVSSFSELKQKAKANADKPLSEGMKQTFLQRISPKEEEFAKSMEADRRSLESGWLDRRYT